MLPAWIKSIELAIIYAQWSCKLLISKEHFKNILTCGVCEKMSHLSWVVIYCYNFTIFTLWQSVRDKCLRFFKSELNDLEENY